MNPNEFVVKTRCLEPMTETWGTLFSRAWTAELPQSLLIIKEGFKKYLPWFRWPIDSGQPCLGREAGSKLHGHPGRANYLAWVIHPNIPFPLWLCGLGLAVDCFLPSLKVIYLAHSLAWWDSTRYMPPVHLASLALRKNIKNGHLNCSSLGGWKMLRHP